MVKDVTITVVIAIDVDEAHAGNAGYIERMLNKAIDNGLDNGLGGHTGIEIVEGWNATTEVTVTDRN